MTFDYNPGRKGWFPAVDEYGEGISKTTNCPCSYIYASFLVVSGCVLGRRIWFRYGTRLYPNQYVCLVGPSGTARKSTAMNLALDASEDVLPPPLRALSTQQGLLSAMAETGGETLVVLDELASMMQQKRRDYATDLIARITELYSCPRSAGTYTRHDSIKVERPFLSILAGSTVEWLQQTLSSYDLLGGLGNRLTFVLGDPRPESATPTSPTYGEVDWERLDSAQGEILWSENGMEVWEHFYSDYMKRQEAASPFARVLAERIPEKILKTAMTIAAWERSSCLDMHIMESAIDWGEYLQECLDRLVPSLAQLENQILSMIERGEDSRQRLFSTLTPTYTTKHLREAIGNLRWLGLITVDGDYIGKIEE